MYRAGACCEMRARSRVVCATRRSSWLSINAKQGQLDLKPPNMHRTPWTSSGSLTSDRIPARHLPTSTTPAKQQSKGKGQSGPPKSKAVLTLENRLHNVEYASGKEKDPKGGCFCLGTYAIAVLSVARRVVDHEHTYVQPGNTVYLPTSPFAVAAASCFASSTYRTMHARIAASRSLATPVDRRWSPRYRRS